MKAIETKKLNVQKQFLYVIEDSEEVCERLIDGGPEPMSISP